MNGDRMELEPWHGPGRPEGEAILPLATEETLFERDRQRESETGPRLDLLTFLIGREEFAAEVSSLVEVCRSPKLTEVPRVPSFFLGLFSLRGTIVPVIDLGARLGVGPALRDGRGRVVIAKGAPQREARVGMLVDSVVHVIRVAAGALQAPPAVLRSVDREMIRGVFLDDPARRSKRKRERAAAAPGGPRDAARGPESRERLVVVLDLDKVLDPRRLGAGS
jgi:chemotaxis signal transduction protein